MSRLDKMNIQRDQQRLVLGVMLSFTLALFIAWPLAYLSAIASCILLASRKPISLVMCIAVTLITALLANLIYWLFSWFGQYSALMLLGLFICCYLTFYRAATGGAKIITLTALLAILIIPTSYHFSPELAWLTTKWLPINVLVGFSVAFISLAVLPLPTSQTVVDDNLYFSAKQAHIRALELSAAVSLFIALFWAQGWTDILMLVFLSLFVHRLVECPSLRYKVTFGYLAANIVGGAFAVLCFELLAAATQPILLLLLCTLALSLLSIRAFTDEQQTVLAFTMVNSFIALMGTATLYTPIDSQVPYLNRLLQISAIALYLLLFFAIYEWLFQGRKHQTSDKVHS